jgi:hypothetical protein
MIPTGKYEKNRLETETSKYENKISCFRLFFNHFLLSGHDNWVRFGEKKTTFT